MADLDAQQSWYQEALGLYEVVEQFELPEPPVRTVVLRAANGVRVELIERAGSTRKAVFGDPLDTARGQGYGHWAVEVDDPDNVFARIWRSGRRSAPAPDQPRAAVAHVTVLSVGLQIQADDRHSEGGVVLVVTVLVDRAAV